MEERGYTKGKQGKPSLTVREQLGYKEGEEAPWDALTKPPKEDEEKGTGNKDTKVMINRNADADEEAAIKAAGAEKAKKREMM